MATAAKIIGYGLEEVSPPDLSDLAERVRLSPTAIKGFLRTMEKWKIKDEDARQLLGGLSASSYYALKKSPNRTLYQDNLTRISLLIGIFKALNILYSPSLADAWITRPNRNPMFGGMSPSAYIIKLGLPGMVNVRRLLDARRGGQ
jgi:hypothetical protein